MVRSLLRRFPGAVLCLPLAFCIAGLTIVDGMAADDEAGLPEEEIQPEEQAEPAPEMPELTAIERRMQSVRPEFTSVGSEMCSMCHPERVELSGAVRHLRILLREEEKGRFGGCESCHGRGSGHMDEVDPELIFGSTDSDSTWVGETCFVCHTTKVREKWLETPHWMSGVTCNNCHSMHDPESAPKLLKYEVADGEGIQDLCFTCHQTVEPLFSAYSHHPVKEGRTSCVRCHNVHEPSVIEEDGHPIVEPCIECHRDKEPPFAFEHEPVSSDLGDGCVTCHNPHGSPNPSLVKLPGRALCLQCHTEQAVGHYGPTTCWSNGCHRQLHGSNADPLFFD